MSYYCRRLIFIKLCLNNYVYVQVRLRNDVYVDEGDTGTDLNNTAELHWCLVLLEYGCCLFCLRINLLC